MRYVTVAKVAAGIPQQTLIWLSNDDPAATEPNHAVIDEIIGDKEDLIDDHLRSRYPLPLSSVPTTVGHVAVKLARHDLYARRPETEIPKDVVREYDRAMEMLRAIRDGKLHLGVEATQQAQPEAGSVKIRAPGRMLGDDVISQY